MSGSYEPRSHVILSSTTSDPVLHRPPYNVELEDLGAVRIFCGNGVLIGTANDAITNRPIGISMTITMAGCSCGCRAPGRGIETMPSVEHARMLAAQLIEAADLVETGARQSASELIGRASGK